MRRKFKQWWATIPPVSTKYGKQYSVCFYSEFSIIIDQFDDKVDRLLSLVFFRTTNYIKKQYKPFNVCMHHGSV